MRRSLAARVRLALFVALSCVGVESACVAEDAPDPLGAERRAKLAAQFEATVAEATKRVAADPKDSGAYSRRGDARFFHADFAGALADYEKMIALDPQIESSHWRRGIAAFYAGKFDVAAKQFEIYHSFDDVDRENGIWRYFSQAKAHGFDKARAGLLKYKKDDREPFPAVYQLFAGKIAPDEIVAGIEAAKIDDDAREARRFYAHLYVGLNHALEGQREPALVHLRKAVANEWGPAAGYGPNYMWHVGRVHYDLLRTAPVAPQRGPERPQ